MWHPQLESAAILLCAPVKFHDSEGWRLILREVHVAPPDAYEERTEYSVKLSPSFGLPYERRARENQWSIVYCHTHPHQLNSANFSPIDDAAEVLLAQYANARSPGVPHGALLLSANTLVARRLGTHETMSVVEVGSSFDVLSDPPDETRLTKIFDRQVRAFGIDGQRRLRKMRIGIVGLGGTGSLVAQQLAHLGVTSFILVDPDCIEVTNLNRTVGALPSDVGRSTKIAVSERLILGLQPDAQVLALAENVVDQGVGRRVAEADLVFCCTDSQASRHILNQVAYQYLVPVIDLGVAIDAADEQNVRFAGHVTTLAPGLPCLWCIGNLDPKIVREESMNDEQRTADPYFTAGRGAIQPAVISINGTIASLSVTMFLSMVTGIPSEARYVIYDGNRSRVSAVTALSDPACNFCSEVSTALGGDAYPLPERRRAIR